MSKQTHTSAFAHFGTTPRNVQWSWSARSPDGKTVVVTLWQDQLKPKDGKLTYSMTAEDSARIAHRPGHRELMENLAWSRDNCAGVFAVIIAIPKDRNADPRSISECFPSNIRMMITDLDLTLGTFSAEQIFK